ncbi:MAG: hypothetical protein K8R88_11435 [Armatimonadetes bacterium]|nr:hypothetical protein [Armatimonadota bacterium]
MFEDKWLVFQKDEFKDVFLSSVDPRQQKLARPKFFWSTYHAMPYGYRTRDMDAGMGVTVNAYTGKIMDLSHYVATFDPPVKKLTRAQAETKAQEFLTDYRNRFPIKGKDYFGYARGQFLNGSHPLLAYVRGNHNYEGPNELYTHPPRPRPDLLAHGRLAHCFLIGKDVIWIDAENGKVLGGWPRTEAPPPSKGPLPTKRR